MPRRMLVLVSLGQFLGMTLWFSATAAAPDISSEFGLGTTGRAWLTIAVQGGFVIGTLLSAVLNLADVINPRRLFAIGALAGAVANAAVTLADSSGTILTLRCLTGVSLACVYPPGMKIAAGWFRDRRGTALGVVVGALTLGSAFPHLLAWTSTDLPWRTLVLASSGLALMGGAIVFALVEDGPYVSASAPFDPRAIGAVLHERGVRLATLGYLGHMWELYAMWAWIPAFAGAWLVARGETASGSLVAFAAIASGAFGCVLAGIWGDRIGKARVARLALLTSALCTIGAGAFFGRPLWLLMTLAVIWGFSVVADSAQFSALVAEYSPRTHVGTALTLQTCGGFLLTMVSMQLLPWVAARYGWQWAFLLLTPGPLLGAVAMRKLTADS